MQKEAAKMMFRLPTLLLVTLSGLVFAGVAVAQEEEEDFRGAPYIGVAFAIGVEQFDDTDGFSSFDEAFGVDVWLGMRSSPYLGVELQFTYLKGFDTKFDSSLLGLAEGKVDVDAEIFAGMLNFKFYPWQGRYQPYALLGLGAARLEISAFGESADDTDVIAHVGAGLDFNIYGPFDAVVGWRYVFTTGDIKETDFVAIDLGVQYKF
jgi:opacity protein-like surface antigen